jgi:hypothetical protein
MASNALGIVVTIIACAIPFYAIGYRFGYERAISDMKKIRFRK